MAHSEQRLFCEGVRSRFPDYFNEKNVLDVGSLDVNGNNRYLFSNCAYVGVDVGMGRNVDVVSLCHLLEYRDEYFDTIISTECFEHDVYFPLTFKNVVRMLKRNGLLLFTCATTGRRVHGTVNSEPMDSPLTISLDAFKNYYKNITEHDIREIVSITDVFDSYSFDVVKDKSDLRFWGVKRCPH